LQNEAQYTHDGVHQQPRINDQK